jgi:hypothetical protein
MMGKTNILVRSAIVLCLCTTAASMAKAQKQSKQLEKALEAEYGLTEMENDGIRIRKSGTVFVLQKDGIYAFPSIHNEGLLVTKVTDGNVEEPKGFWASLSSNQNDRPLKKGATVYVTSIWVRKKDVQFSIITCDTSQINANGNTRNIRYAATVAFEFSESFLEGADASAVKKAVDAVMLPQSEVQAAGTKTVELGQTTDQVRSVLGAPDKIAKLGPKEIYIYKDMKVVFTDGKVSDVQ